MYAQSAGTLEVYRAVARAAVRADAELESEQIGVLADGVSWGVDACHY